MMIKKLSVILVLLVSAGISMQAISENVTSLRGSSDIDQDSNTPESKQYPKDGAPIARDYVQQPPLVPHKVDRYRINLKANKCLTCHSWNNYREAGATKISQTHFEDRDANVLANVSPLRYNCTQCHVPQVNAQPLVENEFTPVTAISGN